MIGLLLATGLVVLLYAGFTAWEGERLRPSSLLLSGAGWLLVVAAALLALKEHH